MLLYTHTHTHTHTHTMEGTGRVLELQNWNERWHDFYNVTRGVMMESISKLDVGFEEEEVVETILLHLLNEEKSW